MENEDPNEYRNPYRINEPLTFIIWPMNQIMPLLISIGVGIIFEKLALCVLAGIFCFALIRFVDRNFTRGYLIHLLWWYGLTALFTKETTTVQDPTKKEFFR